MAQFSSETKPMPQQPPKPRCIVCGFDQDRFTVRFVKQNCQVVECPNCSFHFIPPEYRQAIDYQQYKSDATVAAVAAGDVWIKIQRNLLRYRLIKKYVPQGSIFDIGCGFGHFLLAGRQLGYDVAGVETSKANVRFVREQLGIAVEENDFFQVAETKTYDLVTAWDVLEHIDGADRMVEKAARILKPDGYFILQVPQLDSFFSRLLGSRWWAMGLDHVNYFSKQTIQRLLQDHGLQVVAIRSSLEIKNILLYVIVPALRKKPKTGAAWTTTERQETFNRMTRKPMWMRQAMVLLHNALYHALSFLRIGDEMIVVAKKPGVPIHLD